MSASDGMFRKYTFCSQMLFYIYFPSGYKLKDLMCPLILINIILQCVLK